MLIYGLNILGSQLVQILPPIKYFRISTCSFLMNRITSRFRSLIKSFREHVLDRNKNGLVPKLIYNIQLSPECKELDNMEVLALNGFLQFHDKIASGNDVGSSKCQCSKMSASREILTKHEVKCEEVSSTCDCGKMHMLPVPLN